MRIWAQGGRETAGARNLQRHRVWTIMASDRRGRLRADHEALEYPVTAVRMVVFPDMGTSRAYVFNWGRCGAGK